MSKAPGYQKWPEHKIRESRVGQRVTVKINGQTVADSTDAVLVDEDRHPPRYYFPRADVRMDLLERTGTTTQCPFKGTANYFKLHADGKTGLHLDDAVWSYEQPYEEHQGLKDRLAFYDDKYKDIKIGPCEQ